jgi:amino acid adenylation domain-containing protein
VSLDRDCPHLADEEWWDQENWNRTEQAYPRDKTLVQLFEEQVAANPEAVALLCEEESLSYGELNERANQLAHYLRRMGVAPEVRVGIGMERSLELVVGLLGIVKAGGAYVPLDPAYPLERLSYLLQDAGVRVLLTQSRLADRWPRAGALVLCLDTNSIEIAKSSVRNPLPTVGPENLAYVIYTSGSTGNPKGAMICHQGLTNYLTWCSASYRVAEGTGAPVHSSIGFDLTVTSLWAPLISGRTVTLLPEGYGVDALASVLQKTKGHSLVKITPIHLWMLTSLIATEDIDASTRCFVVGGEALTYEQIALWRKMAPGTRIINEYGPTETVVGCCVYEVGERDPEVGAVPIGTPIANTSVYVLDRDFKSVPTGVEGELFIGGAGVSRGYLNRPALTAEKFVPNPFSHVAGDRMYRTGDRARWRSDGNLEFLGRVDEQVKIRGYRVEPGEVEAVLTQHPSIREAAVIVREDEPGEKRLVGYVVAKGQRGPTAAELRSYMKERMPEYLVPSAFVRLAALPLTPNGKVDRRHLPPPEGARPELEATYAAPRTKVEEQLTTIWGEVLSIERVGIHDNFFELGGHSLLATQVTSRIRETLLVRLSLRHVFESPTIAKLASAIASDLARNRKEDQSVRLKELLRNMTSEEKAERLRQMRSANTDAAANPIRELRHAAPGRVGIAPLSR